MRLWLRNFVSRANGYLGNPLEWQSSSKAVLLGAITAIIYLHYALLAEFLLRQGGDSQFIDPAYLVTQVGWFYGFALASLVLSLLRMSIPLMYLLCQNLNRSKKSGSLLLRA